jgi:hypothetical protein
MKLLENKTTTAIAIFLMLTIAATIVALPIANAHYPAWTYPTWCYCAIANSIIGVNQPEVIVFWVNAIPPTAQGAYGDRWTFWVDITNPGGSNETLGPFTSDPIGGGYTSYTPTEVGTYIIVTRMDEHVITGQPLNPLGGQNLVTVNDTFLASASDPVEFTVQQEAVQPWPEAPLPTLFWTRPINEANRNWAVLAGNWLGGAAQNVGPTVRFCYGTGPESAHVMWATPMWAGGIMDTRFGDTGFQTGHYEGLYFDPPIILNGKLYYNVRSLPAEGWYCLNLYTGEAEYFHNTTGPVTGVSDSASGRILGESLAFGQIYNYEAPNQHGGMPYLWSTTSPVEPNTWMMFDAFTGNYMCSINNVPSWASPSGFGGAGAGARYGKDGSILAYRIVNLGTIAAPNYYLQCWNTSRAIWYRTTYSSNAYWMWRPGLNVTYDGNNGFSLNASIPAVQGSILAVREDQYVIGGTAGKNNGTSVVQGNLWALNLKPDSNGIITPTLLWNKTYTPPQTVLPDQVAALQSRGRMTGPMVDPEDGVFFFSQSVTRQWWGFSLDTMQQLWVSESEPQMEYYEMPYNIYQGTLLSTGYSGVLFAYNITTGNILWNYTATQVGFESPYGNYPLLLTCIADGKIYVVSGEHSPSQPLWRGSYLRCINASNGAELWKVLDWGNVMGGFYQGIDTVMADGYVVGLNLYDAQIYCFGKGPSATTVSASPEISVHGSSVLIKGTVTDQCAGAKKIAEKVGFANGVPAVSDESQEAWMEWLYEQQGKPDNATGVDVSLDTIDPNGNYVHIATVTSDLTGTFGYKWTPEVPGTYQVIATFAGSAAYYESYAQTYAGVDEAPAATAPPEYPQPIDPTMTIIAVGIAIIIAVAIGVVLILRKK